MKKVVILSIILFCASLQAQSFELSLLPSNMRNYIGKVNKEQFEKIIGEPMDYNNVGNYFSYAIVNASFKDDKYDTTIKVKYKNNKLHVITFPTKYYLSYWTNFVLMEDYPKDYEATLRNGIRKERKDKYGNILAVEFRFKNIGLQIRDIDDSIGCATMNYFATEL